MKKATIVVKLVPESSEASNNQIVKDILTEARIPWTEKIEKVTISKETPTNT
jgi:hypothetical protein